MVEDERCDGNINRGAPGHQGLLPIEHPSPFKDALAKPGTSPGLCAYQPWKSCGAPEGDLRMVTAG